MPTDPPEPGRLLGDCELLEEIGRGGMGVVWRGRQRALHREVAVKTLAGTGLDDAESRARFRTEAQATARLRHPNIVAVFDVGESDGTPFLVMELVVGRNLLISLSYNGVGVGLAAAGILEPWSAALVMLVSSLLVGVRAARSARPEA